MAGAGRGAQGELDATHGFSGVVSCGHQWFPVKWAGGLQGRKLRKQKSGLRKTVSEQEKAEQGPEAEMML